MKAIIEIASNADMHRQALEAALHLAAGNAMAADLRIGVESRCAVVCRAGR